MQTDIPNASSGSTDTTATEYSYDNLNRLYTVTDHHNQVTTYTYDDVGNRETVTYPNGTSTTYVYDALNRLETMQTVDGSNQIISQFDYTVYPTGHRHTMTDLAGNSSTYMYDELYRLTSETINHGVLGTVVNSYTYDNVGNRDSATENGVTTTYIYDMNDRLVSSTQNGIITTYAYDDNGNTLSKAANGDDTTFSYDARNKLTAAVQHQGGSPVSNVYFEYDIDGNRTQKTDNGNITNFVVDRNQSYAQVVHETNDQNATQVTYTHGDDLISQDRSASVNYYNYDGLGSTRSLTDSAGLITDTVDYNAYGSILHQTGTTTNRYLYTGEQFDASLDNYYLRARYYDPAVGRFTQMDEWMGKLCNPKSLNKYAYTTSDPINGIDPSGKITMVQLGIGLGIVGILSTQTIQWQGSFLYGAAPDPTNCSGGEKRAQIRNVGMYEALTAKLIADEALTKAHSVGLTGGASPGHNDAIDAFRHCYWSCKMAKAIGVKEAGIIGDTHETCGGNPSREFAMDTFNNNIGISLSTSGKCEKNCLNAAKTGKLQLRP